MKNGRQKYALELKDKIIGIARDKKLPLDELWLHLKLECKILISRAQLSRYLREAKLTSATRPKPPKERIGEFKDYPVGFAHEDIFYLPKMNGRQLKVINIIERKTRYAQATIVEQKTAQSVADAIQKFNATAPMKLHRLLTDNGTENTFRCLWRKTLKEHPLDKVCRENGIKHKLTRQIHPLSQLRSRR